MAISMGMDRVIQRKKAPLGLILGLTVAAGLAAVFGYQLLVVDSKPIATSKKAALKVSTVRKGAFQEYFLANAYVAPSKTVYVDSQEYGIVASVYVDQGSIVRKGDPLAKLRNEDLESQLALKQASYRSLEKDLGGNDAKLRGAEAANRERLLEADHQIDLLQDDFDRKERLYQAKAIAEGEYLKARKELGFWTEKRKLLLESQASSLDLVAQERSKILDSMEILRIDLARLAGRIKALDVVSPAYGQVTALNASVGESKNVGSRIAQLDIMDTLKLKATIDEYYLRKIDVGAEATFAYPDAKGEDTLVPVAVSWIASDVKGNAFEVEFKFKGALPAIRIGQRLVVKVELGEEREALMLEQGQFYQSTGGAWAYLLDPSGASATKRAIAIGKNNPDYLEVLGGLSEGDKVIVSDYSGFNGAEKIAIR